MLIRTVKPSDNEINFQSGFVWIRQGFLLKTAYGLREGVLRGVFDS